MISWPAEPRWTSTPLLIYQKGRNTKHLGRVLTVLHEYVQTHVTEHVAGGLILREPVLDTQHASDFAKCLEFQMEDRA